MDFYIYCTAFSVSGIVGPKWPAEINVHKAPFHNHTQHVYFVNCFNIRLYALFASQIIKYTLSFVSQTLCIIDDAVSSIAKPFFSVASFFSSQFL